MDDSNQKDFDPVVVSFGPYHHGKSNLHLAEEFKRTSLRIYASYCDGKSIEDLRMKVRTSVFWCPTPMIDEISDTLRLRVYELFCRRRSTSVGNGTLPAMEISISSRIIKMKIVSDIPAVAAGQPSLAAGKSVLEVINEVRMCYDEDSTNEYDDEKLMEMMLLDGCLLLVMMEWVINTISCPSLFNFSRFIGRIASSDGGLGLVFLTKKNTTQTEDPREYTRSFRSVTEIKAKGIFTSKSQTHINFKSRCLYGKLDIPPLVIGRATKSSLLNLIAYEMCPNNPNDFGVTSYVRFMKMLIQHSDDVKELCTNQILHNFMCKDDKEVVTMFKDIIASPVNVYASQMVEQKIQKHYNSQARTLIVEVITKYLNRPWKVIALLTATVLLISSLAQTYFTIYHRK
ncbi:hypothetical protein LguiB_033451 [Lonicera macranthoides]